MSRAPAEINRNQDATCYVGNIDERASDTLIWELMLQAGPIVNVHLPKDRISQSHQGYGFAEFQTEQDADYACKIMNGIKLFGKPLRVNKASSDRKQIDIGANLFMGNLDANVDERNLYDAFILFGSIVGIPKVARDPTTGVSKGYGFVSYDSFEAADAAIESMNNQYLLNKPISVDFALKKDGKGGEKHGTAAERLLAAQARKNNAMPAAPPPPPGFGMAASRAYGVPPGFAPPPPPGMAPYGGGFLAGAPPPPPPPPGVPQAAVYGAPGMGMQPPPPPPPGSMPLPPGFEAQGQAFAPPAPPSNGYAGPPPAFMTGTNTAPLGRR
ncbi:RNA-binding domain-containing protein [Tilletiaria anomala UBC 951]|uniref:RNA-binding domain-containing protein n=1 Tax=Tilletiaria anomala (strain ATCC 24038 / CBS 436.72 / UBC 951) TaxID=1037660 RepID=A0A066VU42_TILAU|nr:RNA-binding domain-containing protein [Tilletiaria anomala UBC 951]KDN45242.1 RNA-binding domain-containing protein [Tilletiaria anomala UBC 951]